METTGNNNGVAPQEPSARVAAVDAPALPENEKPTMPMAASGESSTSASNINGKPEVSDKMVPFSRMFLYADYIDKILLVVGTLSALVFGLCQPLSMIVTGALFDAYGLTSVSDAAVVSTYFCYIAVAVIISATSQMICFSIISTRISARVQTAFFESILKQDVTYFDLHQAQAGLASIASSNMALYRAAIGEKLGLAIQQFSLMLSSFIIGFSYSWQLALVIVAFCPLIGLGGYYFGSQATQAARDQLTAYATAGAVIDEALGSIRTVTSLSLQKNFVQKLKESLKDMVKKGRRSGFKIGLGTAVLLFGYQVSFAPSYYVGALLVTNDRNSAFKQYNVSNPPPNPNCAPGMLIPIQCSTQPWDTTLTFNTMADVCNCALCMCGCYYPSGKFDTGRCVTGGDILLVFFSVIIGGFGLGQFFPNWQSIQLGRMGAAKIFEIIEAGKLVHDDNQEGRVVDKTQVKGEIVFENAMFAYPARPDVTVLNGTNLTIPAGKRLAICGASGSGKSSIVSLILRFYDLKAGRLLLDGEEMKQLNVESVRACIGLVSQEPVLFAGVTIKENVRFGFNGATDEDIIAACKMANAHDFIMRFPNGYDTVLVGSSLSGGQKQRVAIARALIRNPRILILDEASAALDTESERLVNEAIDQVVQSTKRTVIVVAHRLSTIRTCETIVVMGPGGRVVEQGTHDELLTLKGAYFNMNMAAEKKEKEEERKGVAPTADTIDLKSEAGDDDDDESTEDVTGVADVTPTAQVNKTKIVDGSQTAGEPKAPKKTKSKKTKNVPMRRIFRFSYPERFWYIPALLASGVSGAIDPLLAYTFSHVIPSMYYMNNAQVISDAALYAWVFFGLGCLKGLSAIVSFGSFGIIASEMSARVRTETFAHLLRMDMAFFDEPRNNIGAMSQKLAKDAGFVKASLGDYLNVFTTIFSGLATGLVIAFIASWKLTLVVFALFPVTVLGFAIDAYVKTGGLDKLTKSETSAAQTFTEAINGFRTVCAFNLRGTLVDLYHKQLEDTMPIEKKGAYVQGVTFGFSQSVQFFAYSIMFYYSAVLLNNGEITFQNMLQSLLAIVFTASNAGNALAMSPDISKGKGAVQSIFSILDRQSKIDPLNESGLRPSTVMGDLKFENVSFAYPSRKQAVVLKEFNFDMPRGTVLALVGESGSGKSTIIQLLERFYDPDTGRVLLDGNSTVDLNVMWLRSCIGLVSQEPVLFDDTIYNNIRFGLGPEAEGKSEEEISALIETSARDANAHDFIMGLPNKYQTRCGQKGSQMSGGQKQRIAIARALIRDPDVLLCDEATSALDEESQRTVQDAIDRLLESKKRTVIIIAHRLSTVQRADIVLVLKSGQVVETGKYDELAEKEGGHFRALLLAQNAAGH